MLMRRRNARAREQSDGPGFNEIRAAVLIAFCLSATGACIATSDPEPAAPLTLSRHKPLKPSRGFISVRLSLDNSLARTPEQSDHEYLIPWDGELAAVLLGAQVPVQTEANNTITTTFVDAGLTFKPELVRPVRIGGANALLIRAEIQDAHVLQVIEPPVRVPDVPQIVMQRCSATWILARGQQTVLHSFSRTLAGVHGAWQAALTVDWVDAEFPPMTAEMNLRTALLDLSLQRAVTRLNERFSSAFVIEDDGRIEFSHGRAIPVETLANNTLTTAFKDVADQVVIRPSRDGSLLLQFSSERVSVLPDIRVSGARPPLDVLQAYWRFGPRRPELWDHTKLLLLSDSEGNVVTLEQLRVSVIQAGGVRGPR